MARQTWVGDTNWQYGPMVLSGHSASSWRALRARASTLLKPHHRPWPIPSPAELVDLDGPALVLPRNYESAWQPRPWGGYVVRMIDLDELFGQAKAAKWNADQLDASAWRPLSLRFKVRGTWTLVDFACKRPQLDEAPLKVALAPGEYVVDVADEVKAGRDVLQILRLRSPAAVPDAVRPKRAAPAPAVPEVPKGAAALAKKLRMVESEGGPLLLVAGDDLPAWRGVEGDDYDRVAPTGTVSIRVGKGRGLTFGSPDPTGFLEQDGELRIVRNLGSDGRVATAGAALLAPKWKKTKLRIHVGRSRALYLLDSAGDGVALARRKRMPEDAARIDVASGDWMLETSGELSGELRHEGKTLGYRVELYRLRRM